MSGALKAFLLNQWPVLILGAVIAYPWVENRFLKWSNEFKDSRIEALDTSNSHLRGSVSAQNEAVASQARRSADTNIRARRAAAESLRNSQTARGEISRRPITPESMTQFFSEIGQ